MALVALALAGCTDNHDDSPSPPPGDSRFEMPPEIEAYVEALRAEDVEGVRGHLVAIVGDDHDVVGDRITAECAQAEIARWSQRAQDPDVSIFVEVTSLGAAGISFERSSGASDGKGVWQVDDEWKVLASASPECVAP